MMNATLTIGIPSLNGEKFLREAALSALTQIRSNSDVEVLILDNASSDGTREIAAELKRSFPSLRVERNNDTLPFNNNVDRLVEISSGEYVWILADDDVLVPGAISSVIKALDDFGPSVLLTKFQVVDGLLNPIEGHAFRDSDISVLDKVHPHTVEAGASDAVRVFDSSAEAILSAGFEVFGLLSAIVVRRDLWVEQEPPNLQVGDGFDFLYKVPTLMTRGTTVLLESNEVLFRQYTKRWQQHYDYRHEMHIYFVVIPTVIRKLMESGFESHVAKSLLRRHLSNFVLHLGIARSKGFVVDLNTVTKLVRTNWRELVFWIQIPTIFLPASIVQKLSVVYTSNIVSKIARKLFH